MNIDDSKKRYCMIIAGILITVVSVFIASSLVIGDTIRAKSNTEIANLVPSSNFGLYPKNNSGFDDVSLAKDHGSLQKDTKKGTIEFEWLYCEPLDLCITQDVLDSWGDVIRLKIKGKYEPVNGTIDLTQGNLLYPWKYEDLDDFVIKFYHYDHEPCYYDYWYGYLEMPEGVDYIELASNQWPDGAMPEVEGCKIPGKMVNFDIEILYQGCSEKEQQFRIIMTHKSQVSGIPNSR